MRSPKFSMFSIQSTFPWLPRGLITSGSSYDVIQNGQEISRKLATLGMISSCREAECCMLNGIQSDRKKDFRQPNYYWDLVIKNKWKNYKIMRLVNHPRVKYRNLDKKETHCYITHVSLMIRFPDYSLADITILAPLIARFMGPTWGASGADRTQVGLLLAP